MAVAIPFSASYASGTTVDEITVNFSGTVTAGNLLLCACVYQSGRTLTTPSGWTVVGGVSGGNAALKVFKKIAEAADNLVTFTVDSATHRMSGTYIELSGTDGTVNGFATNSDTVDGTSHSSPDQSGVPSGGWCWAVYGGQTLDSGVYPIVSVSGSGWNERTDTTSTSASLTNMYIGTAYNATGTGTVTGNGSSWSETMTEMLAASLYLISNSTNRSSLLMASL